MKSDIFLRSSQPESLCQSIKKGSLLNQRLGQWCENNNILSEAQFAYKAGYGTTDAIFVLRMLLDMNRSGIHLASLILVRPLTM